MSEARRRAPEGPKDAGGKLEAARAQLRASQEMFRLLVSQVVDYAIFLLAPSGHVASWNEGAQRIKGYTASEIIGKHFSVFYPVSEIRAGKPEWELEMATRHGRYEDEGLRLRKDGSTFYANVVITALRGEAGELRGFAKVTRDITARRQSELNRREVQQQESARLREHAERMAQLERTKSDFLNLASHELRSPLTLVRGYVSMMEDGDITVEKLQAIAPLLSAKLGQMELLINQMLETARLEHDRLDLAYETFDLRQVALMQVSEFRPLAAERTPLTLEADDGPILVRGDRARIATATANLIDNAIKYSPGGGPVRVLVTSRGGHAFLSVEDQGIGISEEQLEKLFTRFGRLDTEANRAIGGTGLGLYLSREIARRHGGEILVESGPGRGSRFTLSLPLPRPRGTPAGA